MSIEEDDTGIGNAHALAAIDQSDEAASIEEHQSSKSSVTMELTNGLGKEGTSELLLLGETVSAGESASVASGTIVEANGMKHTITIKEVVSSDGRKHGVSTVSDIDTVEAMREGTEDGQVRVGGVLRDGEEVTRELDGRVRGRGQGVGREGEFDSIKGRRKQVLEGVPRRVRGNNIVGFGGGGGNRRRKCCIRRLKVSS